MSDGGKCPFCQHDERTPVRFTPWGGVIGPMLLNLVKCAGCGKQFNGKSGQRVDRAIRVYTLVMLMTLIILAACCIFAYCRDSATPKGMMPHVTQNV